MSLGIDAALWCRAAPCHDDRVIEVPAKVRAAAFAEPGGAQWLDQIGSVTRTICDEWNLELGSVYTGGTAGLVVAVITGEGQDAVLKLPMQLDNDDPAQANAVRSAVRVHQVVAGQGCAELLACDVAAPALLLERLGPNLDEAGLALAPMLDAIIDTLCSFWQPIDEPHDFWTGETKAAWLAETIERMQHQLDQPLSSRVVDRAMDYCRQRGAEHDPTTAVLCHGDAHGWNTCVAPEGGYKFVDPEGVVAERALDLAVPMREYNEPLLVGDTARLAWRRAEHLAQRCGVDVGPVWQWGFIERVSTGLAGLQHFGAEDAAPFFEVAERCLDWDPV